MSKTLHLTPCTLKLARGFTLIEVLVVVSILTLFSTFLILYTRTGEAQIKILKDKASFIGAMSRARALALSTFESEAHECGYGVRVLDDHRYAVWRDTTPSSDCKDANGIYDGVSERVGDPMSLEVGLRFLNSGESDFLQDILFVPPDPQIVTVPGASPTGAFRVVIGTEDRQSSAVIGVNKFGQIQPSAGY